MDCNDKKYFNMDMEPLLNTPEMGKIQERKLSSAMRFFYDKVPFDRDRMDKNGVKPEDIKTLKDLAKAVPISGQADFRKVFDRFDNDMNASYQYLFGKERMDDMYLLTTTSGTTGIPTPYPVFHKTTETMGDLFGRICLKILN